MKKLLVIAAIASVLPFAAQAESNLSTGGSGGNAVAHLDFTVTVPRVLFLQVGAGSNLATGGSINALAFNVLSSNVGTGSAVAATGGDVTGATDSVTVRVLSNQGNVTLTNTSAASLSNGSGSTIPWSEINVTNTTPVTHVAGYTATPIAHPAFNGGTQTLPATGGIVNPEGSWTFAYKNSNAVPPGTYGSSGTVGGNGRVTYTASAP